MRTAEIKRTTSETDVYIFLNLDGTGNTAVATGCGFLDHMLTLFGKHGCLNLTVKCTGDTEVDYHHTVEDTGIALGTAVAEALGDKRGIKRYGSMLLPMDEALVLTALDLSGRAHLEYEANIPTQKVGDFDTELAEEFWYAFARAAACTLHIRELAGRNSHHIIEAMFKGVGRSLREAVSIDERTAGAIPSTKGTL